MTAKVNIRKTLAELPVGESAEFSLDRYDYVLSCRTRLQQASTEGAKWSSCKTKTAVIITREI